jgi:predicted nucleic acid-binding protein
MPEGCVVDTDVVSYLLRGDTRAAPFRPYLIDRLLAISFMTVAELDRWALQRRWGPAHLERLAAFLEQFVIVLADRALCHTWAEVMDGARRRGRPIGTADAWIAATAVARGVPLVTNNRRDYAGGAALDILPEEP